MAAMNKNNKRGSAIIFGESITDKIRKRAQELYNKRGGAPGNDWADWFEAERQIKSELKKSELKK